MHMRSKRSAWPVMAVIMPMSAYLLVGEVWGEALRGPGWVAYRPDPQGDTSDYQAKFSGSGWYVDANGGDDQGPGTAARPWKTLSRAASASLHSGDALLLKCGAVWREPLVLSQRFASGSNVLVGAYGDCKRGQRPMIKGSKLVPASGWKRLDGMPGGFVGDWSGAVQQLHVDGQPWFKARYPRQQGIGKEFALADGTGRDRLRVRPAELRQLQSRDVVGASIYVRAVPWQVEQAKVIAFDASSGLLTLDRQLPFTMQASTGYFLEGKRWMLGSPNEWFHDPVSGQLFLVFVGGTSPSASVIEATVLDRGIVATGVTGLTIERVALSHFGQIALEVTGADRPTVSGIRVQDANEYGIHMQGVNQATVRNSVVEGAGWTGISLRKSPKSTVQGNQVIDTGLRARSGGTRAAITVEGDSATITDNVMDRSANLGINFFNLGNTRVADNTVVAPCMRLTDCGGIYTWTSTDIGQAASSYQPSGTIERNIVLGGAGNLDGTPTRGKNQACGIYLDELSAGISVASNLVVGSELGICLHNARFNVVTGNTVGAVTHASFSAHQSRADVDLLKGNRVLRNKLMAKENEVAPVTWSYPSELLQLLKGKQGNEESDNRVVTLTGERAFYKPYAAGVSSSSLVPKGPFVPYFNPAGSGGAVGAAEPCPRAPCVRFVAGHSGDLLSTPSFTLDNQPGKDRYVLSFTAKGGDGGGLSRAVVRRAGPTYEMLGVNQSPTLLKPGEVLKTELVFQATGSGVARIDFSGQVRGETIISDVSLKRVSDFRAADLSRLTVQLVNLSDTARAFQCAETGLSNCNATDDSGQAIKWPITVAPRSTSLVLALDPKWRK